MDQIELAVISTLYVLIFSFVLNLAHEVIRFLKARSSKAVPAPLSSHRQ